MEKTEKNEMNAINREIELRKLHGDDVETRMAKITAIERGENNEMVVEGMAAVFDTITNIGLFNERVERNAFDNVLNDDVRFLVNHGGLPLARTKNGTLTLEKRDDGLFMRANLANTERGREIYDLIERGDIDEMSFAAKIKRDGWQPDDDGVRVISRVESLVDVSAVTFGAYPTTSIQARSYFEAAQNEVPDEVPTTDEKIEEIEPQKELRNNRKLQNKSLTNMNLNELKSFREKYFTEHAEIIRNAEQNGTELDESQNQRCDWLVMEVERLDNKIKHRANSERMQSAVHIGTNMNASEQNEIAKMNRNWSLSRAIKQIATNNRLEGVEAEWTAEARKDNARRGLEMDGNVGIPQFAIYRADETDQMAATSSAAADAGGTGFVPTNVPGVIEALRAPSVIEQTGVTVINNATGNLKFPRIKTKATLAEAAETAATTAAGIQMDEVTLTPERVTAFTVYSKQLAMQGGPSVDSLILGDLVGAMNARIDTSAFADIIATVDGSTINIQGTDGANKALNAALVYGMEAAVLADGGNLADARFVMSPKAFQHSRSEAAVSSVSALWNERSFAGYGAIATPYLVDDVLDDTSTVGGQMLFGNFRQAGILARFGSPDLLIDPLTMAANGQIKIHINAFWDFALRQPQALAYADQLT